MRTVLAWLLLAAPGLALAAEPKAVIDGRVSVPAGSPIFLDGSASVSDAPLRWKLIGARRPFVTFADDATGRKSAYFLMPAPDVGVYRVALIAVGTPVAPAPAPGPPPAAADAPELTVDVAVIEVTVGVVPPPPGPTPPPGPGPGPAPPPGPAPVPAGTPIHVTLVVPDAPTLDQAAIRDSAALRASLAPLLQGGGVRAYLASDPVIAQRGMTPFVQQAGGAALIVQQQGKGQPVLSVPLPATEAAVLAAVSKLRGN